MRRLLAALLALSPVSSVFAQQLQPFFPQDPDGYEAEIPEPPYPSRGDQISGAFHWDATAPFSYWQNRAAAEFRPDGTVAVANVRAGRVPEDHKSYRWDTVTVRPALLDKAVYAYRTAGTGHTFLVFTFLPGGAVDAEGAGIAALTFGAEGWSREPYGYNIALAIAGKYPLIWNVTTFANYAEFEAWKKKDTFFKGMNLDRGQTEALFAGTLSRVNETNANNEYYDLIRNSCTNNPINLINAVLPEEQRVSLEVAGVTNPAAAVPVIAVRKFEKKGVLKPGTSRMGPDNYASFDISGI